MKIVNKIKICLIALTILFMYDKCYALTQKEAGEIIAQFAINFYDNFASETIYSVTGYSDNYNGQRAIAYIQGKKTSGLATPASGMSYMKPTNFTDKYAIDCVGFVSFCIHHSLGIGASNAFTSFVLPTRYTQPNQGFKKVTDGSRKPGDILASGGHVVVYIGNGEIIDSAGLGDNYSITRRAAGTKYSATYRISDEKAASIAKENTTVKFEGKGSAEYSFSSSASESLTSTLVLSGTLPEHWKEKCEDYTGYFSWTNVSYVTSTDEATMDEFQSAENVEIKTDDDKLDALLKAAASQVGYKEDGNNDTKFGIWYGMNNQPWCAMFVSWCANEAGILDSTIPKFASCEIGMKWYKSKSRLHLTSDGTYTPKAGDIFFEKEGEAITHTGLVLAYNDNYIYTIEGNTDDCVKMLKRKVDKVYAYGSNGGTSYGVVPEGF